MPDRPHEIARWQAAPLVAALLRAIAADRGCYPHELSATLCSAVESCCLAWLADHRLQWDEVTPVVNLGEERPSQAVTVPAPAGTRPAFPAPPPVPPDAKRRRG